MCGVWHNQKKFFAIEQSEKELIRFKYQTDMNFIINYHELLRAYFSAI
jgi:hypothetical protein